MIRQRNVEKMSSFRASGISAMIWRNISGLNKFMILYLLLVLIILLYMKFQQEQGTIQKVVRLNDYVSNMENTEEEKEDIHVVLNVKNKRSMVKSREIGVREKLQEDDDMGLQDSEKKKKETEIRTQDDLEGETVQDSKRIERKFRIMKREIKREEEREETDRETENENEENEENGVQEEDIVTDVEQPKLFGPFQLEVDHVDTEAGSLKAKSVNSERKGKSTNDNDLNDDDDSILSSVEKSKISDLNSKGKLSEIQNEFYAKDDGFVLPVEKVGKQSKSALSSRDTDDNSNSLSVFETEKNSISVAKRNSLLSKLRSNSKSKFDSNFNGKLSHEVMARGKNSLESQRNMKDVNEMILPVEKIGEAAEDLQ